MSKSSGKLAISSSVSSLSMVSPVMASWKVPVGFDIAYAFRYPYTVTVWPVNVPPAGVSVKPVADVADVH